MKYSPLWLALLRNEDGQPVKDNSQQSFQEILQLYRSQVFWDEVLKVSVPLNKMLISFVAIISDHLQVWLRNHQRRNLTALKDLLTSRVIVMRVVPLNTCVLPAFRAAQNFTNFSQILCVFM